MMAASSDSSVLRQSAVHAVDKGGGLSSLCSSAGVVERRMRQGCHRALKLRYFEIPMHSSALLPHLWLPRSLFGFIIVVFCIP